MKRETIKKMFFAAFLIAIPVTPALAQSVSWQHTNGPYGGIVYSLTEDLDSRLFAGTDGDGVFRSTNNGATWVETNDGLTNFIIFALAANRDGFVFAGTDGGGVFRLDPNSLNWTSVNNGIITPTRIFAIVNSIVFNDSGHVFAGTFFNGVFRSTNNGDSWTEVNNGLSGLSLDVFGLTINKDGAIFAATLQGGVYRSTDNGASWTYRGLQSGSLYTITARPNGELFTGSQEAGIFRSTNNGADWIQTNTGITPGSNVYFLSSDTAGTVYAATFTGVYELRTGTTIWTRISEGLAKPVALSVLPRASGELFAGMGGDGVFRRPSGTNAWSLSTAGITNVDVRRLAAGPNNYVYAAAYRAGVYRSTDNGINWTPMNNGLGVLRAISVSVLPNGTVFLGTETGTTQGGKIYRSTNAGESWEPVFQASTDVDVYSFNVLQNGDALVGTIGNGMYRSTDNGATWQSISTGLSSSVFFSLSVNQSGHIFAGTLNDGLIRSTNGGTTWTSLLNSGLPLENPFPYVRSMVFNNDSVAFAGTYGRGVYQSTNNGNSWTPRIVGLPIASHFVLSLAINSQGDVFAGTESGIYRWVNNSGNWSDANSGLGNVYVRSVIVTPGGHVLAGTAGSGIFRTVNPTTSVESVAATTPTRFSLEQNYPNPFNPRTNVGFRVAERGFVTLKVFDLLGKEIATLVSEELSAGTYSIPWDASSLPSGVYLYRLQTGAYTETKKALLVK